MSVEPSAASALSADRSPPVNQALEPASVRDGTAATKQAYAQALDFEEMLVSQLSQTLLASSGLGEGEGEGEAGSSGAEGAAGGAGAEGSSSQSGEAAGGSLASLLPQALTEGVMRDGGLGLATQLMSALDPSSAAPSTSGASAGSALSPGGASAGAAKTVGTSAGAATAGGASAGGSST